MTVKKYPYKIECFLEDLFLGSQWSIILGYRRLFVKSLIDRWYLLIIQLYIRKILTVETKKRRVNTHKSQKTGEETRSLLAISTAAWKILDGKRSAAVTRLYLCLSFFLVVKPIDYHFLWFLGMIVDPRVFSSFHSSTVYDSYAWFCWWMNG